MPEGKSGPDTPRINGRTLFVGLLLLSGLILLTTHASELEQFVALVRQAEPGWLIIAFALQAGTYASVATVWFLALRAAGVHPPFLSLIPLGVAKLFSDQAMPSGGVSGTAFFVTALKRKGIPDRLCMAALLLSLVTYYGAYLCAALATILLLHFYHALAGWIVAAAGVFSLFAVCIPVGALWLTNPASRRLPPVLLRIPGLADLVKAVAGAPRDLMRQPLLILSAALLHGSVFLLDAGTLWAMLQLVGAATSFWAVLPGFVVASMIATMGPIPLGLGTFETTCVTMLSVMGVPIEAALTATLLLRGFTVWLPMLPGMWLVRRALA